MIDSADIGWIESWFWPEFVKAGAVYEAAVAPEKTVPKMSASRSVEKVMKSDRFEITVHAHAREGRGRAARVAREEPPLVERRQTWAT